METNLIYNNPFIKVEWEDTPENLTQERIRRVKTYFQNKYNTTNVKIVTKTLSNDSTTRLKSLDVSDEILDRQYQKNLVKDFIKENKIDIKWELINRLDDKVNAEIDKTTQNNVRYNKWFINKIEFSNFLSFGEDNVINFKELDGITVVESNPENFGGKSTATIDLLLFLFFNSTTKSKTNIEVFNKYTNIDEVKVKGYLTIDGEEYIISRIVTRKKGKDGTYTAKSELTYTKIDAEGNNSNKTDEQRRATEKLITSAIGTESDFLTTILTTGHNLEDLIDAKPTERGQILTKFLGLESLKQKEEIAKSMLSEWSKKLVSNTYNKTQLELDIETFKTSIKESNDEITRLQDVLKKFESDLKKLETNRDKILGSRNNDIDRELINTNPVLLQKEIDQLVSQKNLSERLGSEIILKEPSEFYLEEEHDEIKNKINDLNINNSFNSIIIKGHESVIKEFEEGTMCPMCKRPFEEVDHTEEINEIKKEIVDLQKKISENNESLLKLKSQEESFTVLKKDYDEYERNKLRKAKYELECDQKQVEISSKQLKIDRYESNKLKLEENQKIDAEVIVLKTQIESLNGDIRISNSNIDKHTNNISNMTEKIKINEELIVKIKGEEEYMVIFKTYLSIYGKNGISKVIIKNMIPLLNQELHRILVDTCLFTLEININDKNELEFLMIDNETRVVKPLYTGSGYEKTVASLAIRSVLTKVSSLPKPNIVIMDEVFGKIADVHLDMVGEFFLKIKNYFEHIFVISHNPLIRNWSDNVIMIKKEENVSSIDYTSQNFRKV